MSSSTTRKFFQKSWHFRKNLNRWVVDPAGAPPPLFKTPFQMVIERSVHVVQVRQNMLTMGRLRLNWLRDNREKEKPQANLKRQAATRSIPNNEKSLRKGQRCATLKTWILLRILKLAKLSYPLRFLSSHSVAASDGPHAKDFYDHLETACSLLFYHSELTLFGIH